MLMTILYGSETGTAQDIAEGIWKDAKRYGLKCCVMAMDDYTIDNLINEKLMIFVTATTGQGDPPLNMKKFWRFLLRKSLPQNLLFNLNYGVLGLGDSSYEKYNFAAKKLNRRLKQLGGNEILSIGLADDQHDLGIDAIIPSWTKKMWNAISSKFDIPLVFSANSEFIEKFSVSIIENDIDSFIIDKEKYIYEYELNVNEQIKVGKVIENMKTTAIDHFQDVRLIKFKFDDINYEPGDVIYVRPKNSIKQVDNFFNLLKEHKLTLNAETIIKIEEIELKIPCILKKPVTMKQIVEQYWDLNYKPRRSTMNILASISTNQLEKEKLIELSSAIGQDELCNYINRPRRNIIEVLNDFPFTTERLNEKILFELMVPIKPRAYSIASSSKLTPNQVDLLVAIVEYKTKLLLPRLGLCSNWLASLEINDKILCWLQKGTFKFDYTKPMILVGPGTGLAPFRSLLLTRASMNHDLADTILFFGCRNKNKDFHCYNDLENLRKVYNLNLFCAFSRDQEKKIYVQHLIRENSQICWTLLNKGGKIYLSGSSNDMPKYVRKEFVELITNFGNLNETDAEDYIQNLEKSGRYQTETWA